MAHILRIAPTPTPWANQCSRHSRSGVRAAHKAPRNHVTQSLVVTGGMRPRRRHVVVSNSSAVNGVPASATCSLQTESACSAFHEEDGPDEPHPVSAAVFIGRVVICTSFRRLSSGVSFSAPSISSDCCRTPRVRVPAQSPPQPGHSCAGTTASISRSVCLSSPSTKSWEPIRVKPKRL